MSAKRKPSLKRILDSFPTKVSLVYARHAPDDPPPGDGSKVRLSIYETPPKEVVAVFQFSERGFGFGEIAIKQFPCGVFVDTEHMSKEKVKEYLCALVDSSTTDVETDPTKRRRYLESTQHEKQCSVCHPKKRRARNGRKP